MTEFKVGDQVTVWSAYGTRPLAVTTVDKITERKISLKNGLHFNARNNKEWGAGNSYSGQSIRSARPEDAQTIRRNNAVNRLSRIRWDKLEDEQLFAVLEITSRREG